MRQAYAHDAVLTMDPDEDDRSPGGAITTALCGDIRHDPPCPLAPHHTAVSRDGDRVRLRILFATEPAHENEVRRLIAETLEAGTFAGPDGPAHWRLVETGGGVLTPGEAEHAARLAGQPFQR